MSSLDRAIDFQTARYVNHRTANPLDVKGDVLVDSATNEVVAYVVGGIPRFIRDHQNYADNFGYQWNKWHSILSDSRNEHVNGRKYDLLIRRTHFDKFETKGKSVLECGCGGGDDTEVLCRFPFAEIHAFDLSTAVDRARRFVTDPRVVFSQSSIFEIPYKDESFDFVFCHRVLQHTPDPEGALRSISRKAKRGGVLFVHSYHRTKNYMRHFKYKYRFITKRLPYKYIEGFLDAFAPLMHRINERLYKTRLGRRLAFGFVPLEYTREYANFTRNEIIELERLVTFDALTPYYDNPMRWQTMKSIVESEGFEIKYFNDNRTGSPIYLTAVKR